MGEEEGIPLESGKLLGGLRPNAGGADTASAGTEEHGTELPVPAPAPRRKKGTVTLQEPVQQRKKKAPVPSRGKGKGTALPSPSTSDSSDDDNLPLRRVLRSTGTEGAGVPSTFVASDAPTRTEEQFGGLTDIVDLTIGPEEGVAGVGPEEC